ncbi:MAG: S-adenosylmethionine synthetase N-terminal domain-containing protein, partial [Anaerolineae bacterium]
MFAAPGFLFTSESVTEGHPDKLCDQISDGVLDAVLAVDPLGRVACETAVTTGLVLVMGEITTAATVDYSKVARDVVARAGYTDAAYGFDAATCAVMTSVKEQSADIAGGVGRALEVRGGDGADDEIAALGAGDQGMMFGFACRETEALMPLPITLAHRLVKRLAEVRGAGSLAYLRPDGKSQVSVEYAGGVPRRVTSIVLSTQHDPDVDNGRLREDLVREVIDPSVPEEY